MRDTIIVLARLTLFASFVFGVTFPCSGEEEAKSKPKELQVLKASIGIWDAEFEVWPVGLDSPSMTFKGVETNRAFGDYWIASDLDTEINGQTMKAGSQFSDGSLRIAALQKSFANGMTQEPVMFTAKVLSYKGFMPVFIP